jgi:hypothetical protein
VPYLRFIGALDEVSVPHHQIPAAPRGRAVEVSQEAYDDLVTQVDVWEHADGPDPEPEPEPEAVEADVDDESEEG